MSASETALGESPLHRVTLWLCELCLGGKGGECHTPGCALWMNRAPDIPIWDKREEADNASQGRE